MTTARLGEVGAGSRADVLGCELDPVTLDQAVARCEAAIDARTYLQHMSVNVAKLVTMQDDARLRALISGCELVTADGQGVVWASALLGSPLPERVAGIDLMHRLCRMAAERGYKVFILGARRETLDTALQRLAERYDGLEICGARDGYFSDSEVPEVCEEIRAAGADMLFVAMSSPAKEYFLGRFGPSLGVPMVMGVGGSVDVIAGVTRRAPRLMQRLGLEWLFRVGQEPRRLARRYAVTNARFAVLLFRALLASRGKRVASRSRAAR